MRALTLAILGLGVCAQADQLLYDADTGKRTIILKDDGSLWGWHSSDNSEKIFGYLIGSDIYDRRKIEPIGYLKGNVLYTNDGHVLAYFNHTAAIGWTYEQCVAHWGHESDHIFIHKEEDNGNVTTIPLFIFHYGHRYIFVEFSHIDIDDDIHKCRVIKQQITDKSGF